MLLRGGNALWGNTTHSHDIGKAETSNYGRSKLKNNDICDATDDGDLNQIVEVGRCCFFHVPFTTFEYMYVTVRLGS